LQARCNLFLQRPLVFAATVAILVDGCLLLAARAGIRAWGIYLTAVVVAAVIIGGLLLGLLGRAAAQECVAGV
jgi:hypothetical protein